MLTLPERPYSARAEREEQLPFVVRLASGSQDLQRAVEIRASAYSRHLPHIGELLRAAEKEDLRSDVLLLIAERKLDRSPIGSMRIEPNFTGPLRIESERTLPDRFRGKQLRVELTRLGVENGNAGTLVMAALSKAAFEICRASGLDYARARDRCGSPFDGRDISLPSALTSSKAPYRSLTRRPCRFGSMRCRSPSGRRGYRSGVSSISISWHAPSTLISKSTTTTCWPHLHRAEITERLSVLEWRSSSALLREWSSPASPRGVGFEVASYPLGLDELSPTLRSLSPDLVDWRRLSARAAGIDQRRRHGLGLRANRAPRLCRTRLPRDRRRDTSTHRSRAVCSQERRRLA